MSSSSSTNTAAAEELVGLRFNPTDEQLLSHYLKNKMQGKDSHFPEIHCCNHEPWDLLAVLVPNPDMEGFFFSPRNKKYPNSKRSNRATVQGFWKITGKLRAIKDRHSQAVIGYKRILTFYIGRVSNSHKTNYVMHEYEHKQNVDFVLCRLKMKSDPSAKKKDSSISDEADPDSYVASNFENQPAADDKIAEQDIELEDPLLPTGNVGECKESQKDSFLTDENDISTYDEGFFSGVEMYIKQQFPHANINDGESSWGQSPLGDKDSCLTNKNNISANDNHEPVSNTVSKFGSATDDSTREVFSQPGGDLGYLLLQDYPMLSPLHQKLRDVLHGNNCIAGIESQSQFGDYDFSLTGYYSYQQKTPSPSIDSHLPKSTTSSNYSFQGYSALATGETLQCS